MILAAWSSRASRSRRWPCFRPRRRSPAQARPQPKHGGVVKEAGGFVYELVATPAQIVVHVTDEADKPVPVRGSTRRSR